MSRRFRDYRNRVLISVLSVCFALVICEIALRVIDYAYLPLRIEYRAGGQDWRRYHAFEDESFVHDSELGWRPKKDYSVFNSQGFRGRVLSDQRRPNEYRIFAVGDSNTLGWTVPGANWPAELQMLLAAIDGRFTVINAGVYGYSTFQGVRRLKECLAYRPDMVLVSFGSNDCQKVVVSDAELGLGWVQSPLLRTRIGHLVIAVRDRYVAHRRGSGDRGLVFRVSLQQYKDNLNEMIRISKQNHIQCVLLTRPYIGVSTIDTWWKTFASSYRTATIEVGKENGVPVIDVYSYFKDKEDLFEDESHFTIEGHELAAKMILEELKPLLPGLDEKK